MKVLTRKAPGLRRGRRGTSRATMKMSFPLLPPHQLRKRAGGEAGRIRQQIIQGLL
jgi:hypothetical protein